MHWLINDRSVYLGIIFLISQPKKKNRFEHPKSMYKLMDKKQLQFYAHNICLSGAMRFFSGVKEVPLSHGRAHLILLQ